MSQLSLLCKKNLNYVFLYLYYSFFVLHSSMVILRKSRETMENDTNMAVRLLCDTLKDKYCRLLLLTGCSPSKNVFVDSACAGTVTETKAISKDLSLLLLGAPQKQRPGIISEYMTQFLSGTEPVLLREIEILFDSQLLVDPISLFKSSARNRVLIVDWPGYFDFATKKLSYAANNCSEFFETELDVDIFCFDETGETSVALIDFKGGPL